MEPKFFEYLTIVTIFQLVFFAFFLISLKKGNRRSNRILAAFLFSKALCYIGGTIIRHQSTFIDISPNLFFIGEAFEFVLGPALFFLSLLSGTLIIFIKNKTYQVLVFSILVLVLVILNINYFKEDLWHQLNDQQYFSGESWTQQISASKYDYWPN